MKKVIFIIALIMVCDIASAQFASAMRGQQVEPLPEGFKPASTNTFISQYPAVNAQTRQAMFRVVAPDVKIVQLQLGGNHDMKNDEKGVWWITIDSLVVGFHYYANPVVMYFSQTPHIGPVPSAESLKSLDAYFAWRRTPEGKAWAK